MINVLKNKYEIVLKEGFVYIKNYKRIIDIDEKCIYLMIDNKYLKIHGSSLIVSSMDEYDIVIKGIVKSIEYINE